MDEPGCSSGKRARKSFLSTSEAVQQLLDYSDLSDYSVDEFSEAEFIPDDLLSGETTEEEEEEEGNVAYSGGTSGIVSVLGSGWDKGPIVFRVFPFEEVSGIRSNFQPIGPYQVFRMIFSDELINMIITETNRYSKQCAEKGRQQYKWTDITKEEMLLFFAVLFHMGLVQLPKVKDYWRTDFLFKSAFFSYVMKRDRFLAILSYIHFADNETADRSEKLWRVKPVIDFFNKRMHEIYVPSQQLAIDESMMLFRGRLHFRQFIRNKRHKYGIKFYLLCQPNGLTMKLLVYGGKGELTGTEGHTSTVVRDLTADYKGKGYSLYMDNFYNSVPLSAKLLQDKIHSTGTFGKNRKENCTEVVQKKLKKGDTIWGHKDGVVQMKWRDTRDVLVMSTEHLPDLKVVRNSRGQEKRKPEMVDKYNQFMSGIDMMDQKLSYNDILRKTRKWYRKVSFRIFQIMLMNANILNNAILQKQDAQKFHEIIVKSLIQEGSKEIPQEGCSQSRGHFPEKISSDQGTKFTGNQCRQCSKQKLRKRTLYYCQGCPTQPPLCVLCFQAFDHE